MASRIEYGKAGDPVKIIPTDTWNEMILVERDGKRFYVFPEDIEEKEEKK